MNEYMIEAVREAWDGIQKKEGGPFGSVIVKDGEIISRGHNQVVYLKDPTCHGEMQAIRNACQTLHTFDLTALRSIRRENPVRCVWRRACGRI